MRAPLQVQLALTSLACFALAPIGCGGSGQSSGFLTGADTQNADSPPSSSTDAGTTSPPSSSTGSSGSNGASASSGFGPQSDASASSCTGLQCQVHACPSGTSTTISGTIYDPAALNPLYDIVAYVPNSTPQPFPQGAACTSCGALYTGNPIATALTDATGKFTITGAPDGVDIPLVLQVGKWRQQLTIPTVTACQDNPQPDKSLTLPKNHSVGDIPMIAISTGGSDTLECLLSRIGLDDSEYSPAGGGGGHIQIFQGGSGYGGMFGVVPNTSPPAPQSYQALWDSQADLMKFDIVLLSCEGEETLNMNQENLFDYAQGGGRVFASHFHYAWFDSGPFGAEDLASWTPGSNDMGTINSTIVTTLPNGQPFPKGEALDEWLGNVGALTNGELPIEEAKHNADVSASNVPSTPWILSDQNASPAGATQYFSFDLPFNAAPESQCGRVVYSDLHVGAASNDDPSQPIPQECSAGPLSPQEKALEFMLFDLSSCVTPDSQPPVPPSPQPQ